MANAPNFGISRRPARSARSMKFDTPIGASVESAGRARRAAQVRLSREAGEDRQPFVCLRTRFAAAERGQAPTDEADLPSQEARPEAGTWLPRPHGFEGRSSCACPAPSEGTREAQRLTRRGAMVPPLPMIRRKADFDALARQGKARSDRLLVLRSLRTDRSQTRIGLSTPRALGGSVQRNRVRRRLRALVRERLDAMGSGWDLLLIARSDAATASHGELREALRSLLERSGIGG